MEATDLELLQTRVESQERRIMVLESVVSKLNVRCVGLESSFQELLKIDSEQTAVIIKYLKAQAEKK